jgi:hypothetical protein
MLAAEFKDFRNRLLISVVFLLYSGKRSEALLDLKVEKVIRPDRLRRFLHLAGGVHHMIFL